MTPVESVTSVAMTETTELSIVSNGDIAIEEPPPAELRTIEQHEKEEKVMTEGNEDEEEDTGSSEGRASSRHYERIYELEEGDTPTPLSTDPPSSNMDLEADQKEQDSADRVVIDTSLSLV